MSVELNKDQVLSIVRLNNNPGAISVTEVKYNSTNCPTKDSSKNNDLVKFKVAGGGESAICLDLDPKSKLNQVTSGK